jgi:hypothetical protein
MRFLILSLALFAGAVSAGTVTPLAQPAQVPVSGQNTCVGDTFIVADQVTGMCQNNTHLAKPYTLDIYAVQWDLEGNVLSAVKCGTAVNYAGAYHWTYQPGFNAASCYIPRYAYPLPTSPDGLYELAVNGWHGEILTL